MVAQGGSWWAVPTLQTYEGGGGNDNDDNNESNTQLGAREPGQDNPANVFTETIRDVVDDDPDAVAKSKVLERIAFHESLHAFGIKNNSGGPMDPVNYLTGGDIDNMLTDLQRLDVRKFGPPM